MSEDFANSVLRHVVTLMAYNIGWDASQGTALDILADVMKRHFLQLAKSTHAIAEGYGRSEANLDDVALAMAEMNITTHELEEYVQNFDPVTLNYASKVPAFPLRRESKLNFLRPGSEEVLTRPVHVHEYLPPMILDQKTGDKSPGGLGKHLESDSQEELGSGGAGGGVETIPEVELPAPLLPPSTNGEPSRRKETSPEKEMTLAGEPPETPKDRDHDSSEDEIEALGPKSPGGSFVPFSSLSSKAAHKAKRTAHIGENPALKRVRMMLEEEGHPVRELSSAMMTTSGFLTSSREGRLPESRPPPNTEFFDPPALLPPAPPGSGKKKPLTMKRIVEGIKKIEKGGDHEDEEEGTPGGDGDVDMDADGDEEEEEEPQLFGNPDKISTTPKRVPKKGLKTPTPAPPLPLLLKTGGKSSKKLKKKLKMDKEMIKKLAAGLEQRDRERGGQLEVNHPPGSSKKGMKLFGKKGSRGASRALLDKSKKMKDKKFIIQQQQMQALELAALHQAEMRALAEGQYLEEINSDEEGQEGVQGQGQEMRTAPRPPRPMIPGLMRIPKKNRGSGPLGLVDPVKLKKFKNKSLSMGMSQGGGGGGGGNLISPPKFSGLMAFPPGGSGGGYFPKKRGRPRKHPPPPPQQQLPIQQQMQAMFPGGGVPLSAAALANLGRGLMEDRPLKIKKSHMEPDMRSLIPEVHLDLNVPPHPHSHPQSRSSSRKLPPRMQQQPGPSSSSAAASGGGGGGAGIDLLMGLPATPGLIPSNFVLPPPPPLKKMPPLTPGGGGGVSGAKDKKIPFGNVCSSLTITPIDMGGSGGGGHKPPTRGQLQGQSQGSISTPPVLKSKPGPKTPPPPRPPPPALKKLKTERRSPSLPPQQQGQQGQGHQEHSTSGITITPILLMEKYGQNQGDPSYQEEEEDEDYSNSHVDLGQSQGQDEDDYDPEYDDLSLTETKPPISMLAKLDEDMKSKEVRRREKERRKEMKKEKKKDRKDKAKDKDKKNKDKDKDKEHHREEKKKSKKDKEKVEQLPSPTPAAGGGSLLSVPKLTLKLSTSGTPTPVDSPNPPTIYVGEASPPLPPPLKKITIKSATAAPGPGRPPSPELARFSPLVTRTPPKPSRAAKVHAAAAVAADAMGASLSQQFPSYPTSRAGGGGGQSGKRGSTGGRGGGGTRPAAAGSSNKTGGGGGGSKGSKASSVGGVGVGGLITETVGCIVDEQGNKIWICPTCKRQDDGSPMIGCDRCDDWYHFVCVGISETPEEDTEWYCPRCRIKKKKDKK